MLTESEDMDLVATDPAHQRKGAAGALLAHAVSLADAAGLNFHLVALDAAKPQYDKLGFKAIKRFTLDLAEMGEADGSKENYTVSPP